MWTLTRNHRRAILLSFIQSVVSRLSMDSNRDLREKPGVPLYAKHDLWLIGGSIVAVPRNAKVAALLIDDQSDILFRYRDGYFVAERVFFTEISPHGPVIFNAPEHPWPTPL